MGIKAISASREESKRLGVPFDLGLIRRAPGFTVPQIEGTVEGWRAWKVARKLPEFGLDPRLESVVHRYTWYPQQTAEADACSSRHLGDHAPASNGKGCTCGFYSAKNLAHLMRLGYHSYADYDSSKYVKVIGQVANWGQVTEGTLGWRSQYSYPVMLFVPYESSYLAKPLEKAFGCKVRLLNFLKAPGEIDQDGVLSGEVKMPERVPTPPKAGRRCSHLTLPFEGHLASEPYMQNGEEWVAVRWDARPDEKVPMKMANLRVSKKEDHR